MPVSRNRKARKGRNKRSASRPKYERQLDAIVIAGLPTKMPDVLQHYTTWAGFRGIVASQHFRARAHHCTNDTAELTSIDEILTEVATDLVNTSDPRSCDPLNRFLRDLPTRKISKEGTLYLSCFSVAKDKPSQWLSYAENGSGVCMGFKVLHHEKPPFGTARPSSMSVLYDEGAWRKIVAERFGQVLSRYEEFRRSSPDGRVVGEPAAWSALMRIAAVASLRAKKPLWASEEEWRILVLGRDTKQPRLLTPDGSEYIEMRLREPPLRFVFDEILLGPRQGKPHTEAIAEARAILEAAGYSGDEIPLIRVSTADLGD